MQFMKTAATSESMYDQHTQSDDLQLSWVASIPFIAMHFVPLAMIWTGASVVDWVVCIAFYVVRMFGITAGYHRYFAHRTYKVGRVLQFILAVLGSASAQKGVLWWAGHHRHHHKHSDDETDIHSPRQKGFWWSHVGWIMSRKYDETPTHLIGDFARYPELVWLNKYWIVVPTLFAVAFYLIGGWSMLVVGFFVSTILLYHGTFTINSLSHIFGKRRFKTPDDSRNNWLLAIITLGEGWHNNHHYYMNSANQGFYWWEYDISYYVIRILGFFGLAWDIKTPPKSVLELGRRGEGS